MSIAEIRLSDVESGDLHAQLRVALHPITDFHPYRNYESLLTHVRALVAAHRLPVISLIGQQILRDRANDIECHYIANCPVDDGLPDVDGGLVLNHKIATDSDIFSGEVLLLALSLILDNPVLAYETRNGGAYFQDVLAAENFKDTQTQKTDTELWPHNDRTAHWIRADFLSLLGLRIPVENEVATEYIRGRDIIARLSSQERAVLSERHFLTPYDQLSQQSNPLQIESPPHAIVEADGEIRYYYRRTQLAPSAPKEAGEALASFENAVVAAPRVSAMIEKGGLLIMPNKKGLHVRNIVCVRDRSLLAKRWLLKTYNLTSQDFMSQNSDLFVPGRTGLVKELS